MIASKPAQTHMPIFQPPARPAKKADISARNVDHPQASSPLIFSSSGVILGIFGPPVRDEFEDFCGLL